MDDNVLKEALTASYAAGALDPALRLLLETQASIHAAAKAELEAADALAGAMLERQSPVSMDHDALASVMAAVDARPACDGAEQRAARAAGGLIDEILRLPRPLHDLALNAIGHGGWMFAGPGLRTLTLPVQSDSRTELLRIEPGWGAPAIPTPALNSRSSCPGLSRTAAAASALAKSWCLARTSPTTRSRIKVL